MKNKIIRQSLVFGLLAGVIGFLFFIGLYFLTDNPLAKRRPDVGFNLLFVGLSMWYLKKSNGGFIHFYQAFSTGFLTNIFAALTSGLLLFLFIQWIDQTPLQTWMTQGQQLLRDQRETFDKILNEEMYAAQMKALTNVKPYQLFLDELMFKQVAIVGITLLGMVFRKKRPE
ncbi:MAG: DUF4199 domain-containing protein [Spirosomataceae bacterium]